MKYIMLCLYFHIILFGIWIDTNLKSYFYTMISIVSNLLNNIERIDFDDFEKDFLFILNCKIYQTNSSVANI